MSYKIDYSADRKFGAEQEVLLHRRIVEKFGECKKIAGRFAIYDYEGDNFFVELKSRRKSVNQFNTTIIGKNKIDKAEIVNKTGVDVFFCFNFIDGLYFWKYNKEECLAKILSMKGGRKDRGMYEEKDYCYIPIELLEKI
jgi:hypothetical protein